MAMFNSYVSLPEGNWEHDEVIIGLRGFSIFFNDGKQRKIASEDRKFSIAKCYSHYQVGYIETFSQSDYKEMLASPLVNYSRYGTSMNINICNW